MESQQKAEVSEIPATGVGGERSTIEFSYTDLDNAIEIVRGVNAVGGTSCDYDQLAAHLGVEAKGGGFRLRVTGAKSLGLISYERGGRITITELGRNIIDPLQERAARAEAFLTVPLYARVYEAFKGRPLPPTAGLERQLIGFGVGKKVADRARQVMMRSAKQAGYLELAPDRMTAPPIRGTERKAEQTGAQEQKEESQTRNSGSGGNGGNKNLHPLIQGLLLTLPKETGTWPIQERLNWLSMANSIFKMIYPSNEPSEDVNVSLAIRSPQQGG